VACTSRAISSSRLLISSLTVLSFFSTETASGTDPIDDPRHRYY
jgi:hypothetical protein